MRTQEFSCEADARAVLLAYQASCRVLDLIDPKLRARKHYPKAGRPAREAIPERVSYQIEGSVAASTKSFEEQLERASRFIVATNDTTGERLSDVGVLQAYKGQSRVERGFRFLKDPMFLASTLFLKKSAEDHGVIVRDDALSAGLRRYLSTGSVRSWLRMGRWCRISKANLRSGRRPSGCLSYSWMCTCFSSLPTRFRLWPMNLVDELQVLLELLGPAYSEVYS